MSDTAVELAVAGRCRGPPLELDSALRATGVRGAALELLEVRASCDEPEPGDACVPNRDSYACNHVVSTTLHYLNTSANMLTLTHA